jgi:hypothetical protein
MASLEARSARAQAVTEPSPAAAPAPGRDPNPTQLILGPTARTMRKGEGSFTDYELVVPGLSYGVTDHLTIAGGMSILPGVGLTEQAFYVSPKLGFSPRKEVALALGAFVITAGDNFDRESAAFTYAVATVGPPDASLTMGLGYGALLGECRCDTVPVFMLGGTKVMGRSVALVAETWVPLREPDLGWTPVGLAIRFFGERLSADVGAILVPNALEEGFPIPWLSVSYHFGSGRPAAAGPPSRSPLALAARARR